MFRMRGHNLCAQVPRGQKDFFGMHPNYVDIYMLVNVLPSVLSSLRHRVPFGGGWERFLP